MQPQAQILNANTQGKQKGTIAILGIIVIISGGILLLLMSQNWVASFEYIMSVNSGGGSSDLIMWILYDVSICTAIFVTGIALVKIDKRLP